MEKKSFRALPLAMGVAVVVLSCLWPAPASSCWKGGDRR